MFNGYEKILSWPQARRRIEDLRREDRRVVFTNGCFDLLHVGHVRYLAEARGLGDFLIVGLNSDASVTRIKGSSRPLTPEHERAEVLAALTAVDAVVVFEQDDPLDLITRLEPDVLVKGEDWPVERIVGREIVESRGGKVLGIPLTPGVSTSAIIDRIADRARAAGKD
ncbi:MAG: D-glycero-beta-D-manno-heptose 1-phosphate adenylyltransferase [Proteobacteria bacterium]|nr:D-glycero-beta-D-manno-heptose 1-phosphate adenylyltransferase [Pseudomonadota bacterium]